MFKIYDYTNVDQLNHSVKIFGTIFIISVLLTMFVILAINVRANKDRKEFELNKSVSNAFLIALVSIVSYAALISIIFAAYKPATASTNDYHFDIVNEKYVLLKNDKPKRIYMIFDTNWRHAIKDDESNKVNLLELIEEKEDRYVCIAKSPEKEETVEIMKNEHRIEKRRS